MTRSILCIVLVSTLPFSAIEARGGETEQQIEARYGKPLGNISELGGPRTIGYSFSGFNIGVQYFNGISQSEIISKRDGSTLASSDIDAFPAANGARQKWTRVDTKGERDPRWSREDGKMLALFTGTAINIATKDFFDSQLARWDRERKAKLNGF